MFEEVVVAKFARCDWKIGYMANETRAFQWLQGSGIGPWFLGHLVENGRVIGFLMEKIVGARFACPGDLEGCQEAWSRLHRLGVKHGNTYRFNCLVCSEKVIDYDIVREGDDALGLREESDGLLECFQDDSTKERSMVMQFMTRKQ